MGQLRIPESPVDLPGLLGTDIEPERLGAGKLVYIETYGCQMNLADSELMGGVLRSRGFQITQTPSEADVILVNTCAVRERAEERVRGRVASLSTHKTRNRHVVLGVTGCVAEHLKERLFDSAPFIDLIIGPDAYRRLPELIARATNEASDPIVDVRLDKGETYDGLDPLREEGVRGWVTIQRGCDKFCSFCIVPFTRGRERGVPPGEVLRQVRALSESGYKEVILLGQTVNSYQYHGVDFADLLYQVCRVDGIERVRFTSPHPENFDRRLIETIAAENKIGKHLHLPVQSGSDRILAAMKRGHTVVEYKALVGDLRAAIPGLALSTDVIVGFPTETELDYQETLSLLREIRFDFAYMFKYSAREGTLASKKLVDDVPETEKGRRLAEVIHIQESICAQMMAPWVGRLVKVLIAETSRKSDEDWVGRTSTFKTTIFPQVPGTEIGQIVPVRIHSATSHTLLGEIEWSC